jgi:hypothetical protein
VEKKANHQEKVEECFLAFLKDEANENNYKVLIYFKQYLHWQVLIFKISVFVADLI